MALAMPMLLSCSFPASFIIINLSDGPIGVAYEFKDDPKVEFSCPEGDVYMHPCVTSAEEAESKEAHWLPLEPGEYECDPDARTVFVPVGAGAALKVVKHDDPGGEIGALDARRFPIGRLIINGSSGSMEYTGEQVLRAFTRGETGLSFHLTYR
jgi:hypothetical protein